MRFATRRPLSALLALVLSSSALAQVPEPGSLLILPEFDNRDGAVSVLTLTNTGAVDVWVRTVFIDEEDCDEFDRTQPLTGNDTFTGITAALNPDTVRGFLYAYAVAGPEGDEPVVFDHLIGSILVLDAFSPPPTVLPAVTYRGLVNGDADNNGHRDLDGVEYSPSPAEYLIPNFFGVDPDSGFDGELILIGLTGGSQFDTLMNFKVFNDNEEPFAVEYGFHCWERVRLGDISSLFTNSFLAQTMNDPNEVVGAPTVETGWMRMRGRRASSVTTDIVGPAVLVVHVQNWFGGLANTVQPLFGAGMNKNGRLFPFTLDGE